MGIAASGTPPPLSYNLVWNNSGGDYTGCAPGVGSLSGDPLFVDPQAGDYHLGLHSPAIDAGIPGPLFQDPDGSRGDMGMYGLHVFVMDHPVYPKNLHASLEGGAARLTWNRNPEPDIENYAVYGDVSGDFVPSISNFITLVAGTDSTVVLDPPADSLYYRISAIDTDGYAGELAIHSYNDADTFNCAFGNTCFLKRWEIDLGITEDFRKKSKNKTDADIKGIRRGRECTERIPVVV